MPPTLRGVAIMRRYALLLLHAHFARTWDSCKHGPTAAEQPDRGRPYSFDDAKHFVNTQCCCKSASIQLRCPEWVAVLFSPSFVDDTEVVLFHGTDAVLHTYNSRNKSMVSTSAIPK